MQFVDFQLLVLPGLAALGLALLLAGSIKRMIIRIGWLDKPNHRKWHKGAVPLAGGLIIVSSSALVLFGARMVNPPAWQLWAGAAMVFAIAFADDRFPIRARFRLSVQVFAAMLVTVSADWVLDTLGHSVGPFELSLGILALPFTILGIAALTNAVNMTDGMDGMAGGVVVSALFWLLVGFVFISQETPNHPALSDAAFGTARAISVMIGATLAFLVFNQRTPWRRTAAIFLGDGGSMMLGFTIASLCVYIASGFGGASMPAAAVGWVVAVPLIDLFSCIVRRLAAGVTPMTPDRRHLHHLLLALGLPVSQAVPVLQAICFVCGMIGVVGWHLKLPEYVLFYGLVVLFVGYFFGAIALWKKLAPGTDLVGELPGSRPAGSGARRWLASMQRSRSRPRPNIEPAPLSPTSRSHGHAQSRTQVR